MKKNVGLLFGGNSSEHAVSIQSAKNIYDAVDKEKYNVLPFLFSKDGYFIDYKNSLNFLNGDITEEEAINNFLEKEGKNKNSNLFNIESLNSEENIDVFFPIIHGNIGEDGTIQGLLRLLNKPFVGSSVRGMAMSFDKEISKRLLDKAGIRNTDYVSFNSLNYKDYPYSLIQSKLGDIVFVKSANQGSSVGTSRVTNEREYNEAVKESLKYDNKVVVEQALSGSSELEISILGNDDELIYSKIGSLAVPEQGKSDNWYDYSNKFVDASNVQFEIPVKLSNEVRSEIEEMALRAFRIFDLSGLARMDFFIDENGVPYFGEPNTLPGFTNVSLYPQLWEVSGISYSELIDRLIDLSIKKFNEDKKISYSYIPLDNQTSGKVKYN